MFIVNVIKGKSKKSLISYLCSPQPVPPSEEKHCGQFSVYPSRSVLSIMTASSHRWLLGT